MNDRLVTLTVWLLALGFALACALFAWRAATPVAAPVTAADAAGAALFEARCARCHEAGEFTARLAAPDRAVAAGRLLEKLADHGDTGFADDVAIVHWLATQAGPPPEETPESDADAEDDYSL
jgi:mono/diheme cytochrome c family protein